MSDPSSSPTRTRITEAPTPSSTSFPSSTLPALALARTHDREPGSALLSARNRERHLKPGPLGWRARLQLPTISARPGAPSATPVQVTEGDGGYTVERYCVAHRADLLAIERWTKRAEQTDHWRTVSIDGVVTTYGQAITVETTTRSTPEPIQHWLADRSRDRHGNLIVYRHGHRGQPAPPTPEPGVSRALVLQVHGPLEREPLACDTQVSPLTEGVVLQPMVFDVLSLAQIPDRPTTAAERLLLDQARLCFQVSLDEEHIELTLDFGDHQVILPNSTIWFTILTLARERIDDQRSGLHPAEAGWMDVRRLQDMLKITADVLNHHVLRARKALARAGVCDHRNIVERTRVGKIRLGAPRIHITRLGR